MAFFHGVETLEEDKTLSTGNNPDLSIIGLIGTAGKGTVDDSVFVNANRSEVDSLYGTFNIDSLDGFTIPSAVAQIYSQSPASMVIINVADPAVHTTQITGQEKTLGANNKLQLTKPYVSTVSLSTTIKVLRTFADEADATITLPSGIATITSVKSSDGVTTYVLDTDYSKSGNVITNLDAAIDQGETVLVTYTVASLTLGTDYTIDSDKGQISRVTTSTKIDFKATLTVTFNYVNPASVTATYLSGKVAEFLNAESRTGKKPRILIAPGFTGVKPAPDTIDPVVSELIAVAATLRAVVYSDIVETTTSAASIFKGDFDSDRLNVYYANPQMTNTSGTKVNRNLSALAAGRRVFLDNTNSYSVARANTNTVLSGITSIDRVIDFNNDISSTANGLNASGINTIINDGGIRLWGDFTTSSLSSRTFGTTRRILDLVIDRTFAIVKGFLGDPLTNELIERIVDSIQATLDADKQRGYILGGTAIKSDLNTTSTLSDGEIYIDYDITPVKPATRITVTQVLTDSYTSELVRDL